MSKKSEESVMLQNQMQTLKNSVVTQMSEITLKDQVQF